MRVALSSARSGLIPAHAGKTYIEFCAWHGRGAHPRSRGENKPRKAVLIAWAGSSPLTRGKRTVSLGIPATIRLIPAHAGKTRSDHGRRDRSRAHPRSRGENTRPASIDGWSMGSSPLTRGKRMEAEGKGHCLGLIPAHAGKTVVPLFFLHTNQAHPRSRGENSSAVKQNLVSQGSSPLTRGKRPNALAQVPAGRLIPAHAGKTARAGGRFS